MRAFVNSSLLCLALPTIGGCEYTPDKPSSQNRHGSSRNTPVVAGSGVNWSYGDFPYDPLSFAGDLLLQINTQRRHDCMHALIWHDGMALVAQKHSLDMVQRNYLSLTTPEGVDLAESMVSSNPRIDFDELYYFAASDVATASQLFAQLMDNPSGRSAIRDRNMTHFGASFQQNPGPFKVTIIFARNARP